MPYYNDIFKSDKKEYKTLRELRESKYDRVKEIIEGDGAAFAGDVNKWLDLKIKPTPIKNKYMFRLSTKNKMYEIIMLIKKYCLNNNLKSPITTLYKERQERYYIFFTSYKDPEEHIYYKNNYYLNLKFHRSTDDKGPTYLNVTLI